MAITYERSYNMLKHINENTFEEEILDFKGLCLIDFYATWCGPCMKISPILEEISNIGYNVFKVDVDENVNISNMLEIDTVPTICIYKDGKMLEKQIGVKNKSEIIKLIEKYK